MKEAAIFVGDIFCGILREDEDYSGANKQNLIPNENIFNDKVEILRWSSAT